MKTEGNVEEYHLHAADPLKRQFDVFDLNEYLAKNINHSSIPHSHSFYQLIWFSSDKGKHHVDFLAHEIKRDRLFFIAKGQVHYFEKEHDYQGVLLHFNESFLLQTNKDIDFFLNYNLFNNLNTPYFQAPLNVVPRLKTYIDQIRNEAINVNALGHQSILANTLKSLLITVEREKRVEAQEASVPIASMLFLAFRKLLEQHYRQHWLVSDYAQELNKSPKMLNQLVKSTTGKTTSTVINDRVILEAKRLLSHSEALVNEVGYELGFQDPSYFVKFFKKWVKLTPSQFRNSLS